MNIKQEKQGNWFGRHKILTGILGIIVLFVVISAVSGNKQPQASQPAQADKSTTTTTTTTPATSTPASTPAKSTPQTLLDLSGSGTKQTQKFTAAGDWDLNWNYDCSAFGSQGNFQAMVYDDNGNLDTDNSLVNQLGAKGSDVQHYYKAGTFYLMVNSECSWHVTVKG